MPFFSKDYFIVKEEQNMGAQISKLGGTIKTGAVLASLPTEIVKKAFLEKDKEAQQTNQGFA